MSSLTVTSVQIGQNPTASNNIVLSANSGGIKIEKGVVGSAAQIAQISAVGDLTLTGGNVILGSTGRIQGVDVVTASTDAANKAYVDSAAAGTSLASTNGYQILPSGIIMQWGITGNISGDTSVSINFNIPFPNLALNVQITGVGALSTGGAGEDTVDISNNSTFIIRHGQDGVRPFFWYAIGY